MGRGRRLPVGDEPTASPYEQAGKCVVSGSGVNTRERIGARRVGRRGGHVINSDGLPSAT